MFTFFETLLNMSLTASVVILAVLLVRLFMKKAPRKFCYLLWLVVAFRLVVPFSFETSLSIFNVGGEMPTVEIPQTGTVETIPEDLPEEEPSVPETVLPEKPQVSAPAVTPPVGTTSLPDWVNPETSAPEVEEPVIPGGGSGNVGITNPVFPEASVPEANPPVTNPPQEDVVAPEVSVPEAEVSSPVEAPIVPPVESPVVTPEAEPLKLALVISAIVWMTGVAVMLCYGLLSYAKLKKRLATAVMLERGVYGSDRIDTPFALGIIKPRIYIPFGMSDTAKEYILAHEYYHLGRLDHVVKPVAFCILALHWFNPLCWLAFNRMSLDMELSCDEAVLSKYGSEDMKKCYTKTLLDFATNKKFPSPAPISFSEGASAKTRIKNALYWKKPRVWLSVIALLLTAIIIVSCAGNAITQTESSETSEPEAEKIITFGDTPYEFTFVSNGDGTCIITDVLTDYFHEGKYDLVIPETSPAGDKVVEVDLAGMNTLQEIILPRYMSADTHDKLVETIANSGVDGAVRDSKTFKAFYLYYAKEMTKGGIAYDPDTEYYKIEPFIASEDMERLINILKNCTEYTEEQCYEDTLALIKEKKDMDWESEEAFEAFARETVGFFYRSTRDINKVVLPNTEIKVHQGFLGLSFVLADGTAVTPVYENPVTLEIVTAEEPENVLTIDEDGNEVIAFTFSRPVKDFHILTIDMADSVTAEPHPETDYITADKAFTQSYKLLLGENIPTRGISFVGEDGKTHEYAICYVDGKKGSYKLVPLEELAGADFEEFSLLVKRVSDSAASKKTVYLSHPMMSDYDYFSVTPNQPMTNVQIYFFQAEDEHTTKGWWYEGAAASDVAVDPKASVVEFLPIAEGETIYVGAHSTTVTDAWGISFTDYQGNKRYFAVFPTLDGKRQVIEMTLDQTRMQYLPNTCPELDYSMLEVVQTFTSNVFVLHDPRAVENEQYVLIWKKSDGTYVEIHRAREGFYKNLCYAGNYIAFNNFEPECTTEAYVYDTYTGKLVELDQSVLPEEETISFMSWLNDRYLLFVSQLDHGTIVKGGELWCYDTTYKTYEKVVAVSDKRLQITGFKFHNVGGDERVEVTAVYYDETYNFTEDKTYYFRSSALNGSGHPLTLLPEESLYIRPSTEGEYHTYTNITPDASVTNQYALYSSADLRKLTFCTFKAVKEDPAKGWLYEYSRTGTLSSLYANKPFFMQASASYSVTDTWGFFANDRFYAMMEDPLNGNDKLVDITDQVTGPYIPDDLSTVFDDTTTYHEGYKKVVYGSFIVVHIYDWDQYFVLDTAMTLDVTGDTALGFYRVESEESWYYYPGVYRFEKGKAEPTKTVIDVPETHEPSYSYHPVTEKIGYLMVYGIEDDGGGAEYLAQVLKTTDNGLTWEEIEKDRFPTGGTSHDPVNYSTFLTEDFGVIAFLCNFDTDLARHVYYTTDGGLTWKHMTGLNNLPRDPDEEWNLRGITLENGVYTIKIDAWDYDEYIYFTSTDLENWEPVPQVLLSDATDAQCADTENYTHFYDPKVDGIYKGYNAHLLVQVFAPIESFRFEALTEDGLDYIRETLYETNLVPGQPLIIHTYINDVIPICGYSYLNEDGVRVYSELSSSMM